VGFTVRGSAAASLGAYNYNSVDNDFPYDGSPPRTVLM
jgi:hypothetical protein